MVITETNIKSDSAMCRSMPFTPILLVSLSHCLADNFFYRSHALADLIESGFAQSDHPVFNRLLSQLKSRGANQNQLAYLVRYFHHFIKAHAAFVPGVVAGAAARTFVRLQF